MKKSKIGFKTNLPRTIYTDIVGEAFGNPSSYQFGLTIHYYNNAGQTIYFKFKGSGPNWTNGSETLGSLLSGEENYKDMFNFMTKTLPSSETTDEITLTLEGYTDAAYENLYATFTRKTTVVFLKRDDGSWTQTHFDCFEGGMDQENFMTYEELDDNNHITRTINVVQSQVSRNEDAWLYKDYGADYFGDYFEHWLMCEMHSTADNGGMCFPWALTNDVDDIKGLNDTSKTFVAVLMSARIVAGYCRFYLYEGYGGIIYSTYRDLSLDTTYHLKLNRNGTTLRCEIYTDAEHTQHEWTLHLTLHAAHTFQYVFAMNTWNDTDTSQVDMFLQDLGLKPLNQWRMMAEYEGHGADGQYIRTTGEVYMEPYMGHALCGRYIACYDTHRERRWRLYKEFTTIDKNEVFAIIYVRVTGIWWDANQLKYVHRACGSFGACFKYIKIWFDDKWLAWIGHPYDGTTSEIEYIKRNEWMIFVVPLPPNTTSELRITFCAGIESDGSCRIGAESYLDAIRIIARD